MKKSVMARSRTAKAERLKLRIRRPLLFLQVNSLSLVQEMRSERHHLFIGFDPIGYHDFLLPDGGKFDGAELYFRLLIDDPDSRPAAAIIDCADGHQDRLITR